MLAVSMGALVEGLVVRQAVDPDAVSDDLFGIVLLGLRPAWTQDVNEPPSPFQSVVSQYTLAVWHRRFVCERHPDLGA